MKTNKIATVKAEGVAFVAKLKLRGQITLDSSIIESMELKEGKHYQFLVVVNKSEN